MSYPKLLLIDDLSTKVPEKTPEERILNRRASKIYMNRDTYSRIYLNICLEICQRHFFFITFLIQVTFYCECDWVPLRQSTATRQRLQFLRIRSSSCSISNNGIFVKPVL